MRLAPRRMTFVVEYVKDFSPRRAAEASGWAPDHGYKLLEEDDIKECIQSIIDERLENVGIDAEWLLYELADNHRIARQHGNISASNTALKTLMQHVSIDAMAKQKVEVDVVSDKEMLERIQRGRKRMNEDTSFL